MKPIRGLVLGGSGRIGRMLRQAWSQDSLYSGNRDMAFTFQTRRTNPARPDDLLWDVLDAVPPTVKAAGPFDCMIVLSGITPAPGVDFALNTQIGLAGVKAAAELGIAHVLLASTSAVYGNASDAPFPETAPYAPVNDYGRSKQEMEQACRLQAAQSGVGLCCLRIGNVVGADALLLNAAGLAPGETLLLDSFEKGGTPLRSYIGPLGLARVLLSLVRARMTLPFALNIANPHPVTMGALAEAANAPVTLRPSSVRENECITLACDTLCGLHDFDPDETTPREMVRQWQTLTAPP